MPIAPSRRLWVALLLVWVCGSASPARGTGPSPTKYLLRVDCAVMSADERAEAARVIAQRLSSTLGAVQVNATEAMTSSDIERVRQGDDEILELFLRPDGDNWKMALAVHGRLHKKAEQYFVTQGKTKMPAPQMVNLNREKFVLKVKVHHECHLKGACQ